MSPETGVTRFQFSTRVRGVKPSSTLAVLMAADRLKAQGADLIDLGAGEPDFPTPENIKNAGLDAINRNFTKYTPTAGTRALKESILQHFQSQFGASYSADECIASVGGKQSIFNAVVSLIDRGDEVVLASPFWVSFPEIVAFAEGVPVLVNTEPRGFQLRLEDIEAATTPRTRLFILNSPNNPTGRVIPPDEFSRIVGFALSRDIAVVSDECYLNFVYPPHEPFSAASLSAHLKRKLLVVGSFSKTYAMTGWRLGFALGPKEWIAAMLNVQSHCTSNPSSISQAAAVEAFNGSQDSVREMLATYAERRAWLIPALNEIPGLSCGWPDGAFYAYPSIKPLIESGLTKDSTEFARRLLEEKLVALTPGTAFGSDGYVRISYANSLPAIQEGVRRIREFIAALG